MAKRRRKPVVAKRFAVGSVFITELASKTAVFTLVPRNLRRLSRYTFLEAGLEERGVGSQEGVEKDSPNRFG